MVALVEVNMTNDHIGYRCGASIVNDRYILTAAHCFEDDDIASNQKVAIGINELKDAKNNLYDVEEIIIHEGWNEKTVANDIALLKLTKPIANFGSSAIPICLPNYRPPVNNLKLTGWGLNNDQDHGGQVSNTLQEIDFAVISDMRCAREWSTINKVDPTKQICAGKSMHSSCQGDSGGPLTTNVQGKQYQVGITSFGAPDCSRDTNRPTVFTRVVAYQEWIFNRISSGIFCL